MIRTTHRPLPFSILGAALALASCQCGAKAATEPAAPVAASTPEKPADKPGTTQARCPLDRPASAEADDSVPDEALVSAALHAYNDAFDHESYDVALACAQVMTRANPEDLLGHIDRAAALDALDRPEEARDAYERALAIDPDDVEALRMTADFLLRRGTDDALETAALFARRGRQHTDDAATGADLATMEASALNGLGRSAEALSAAETALALDEKNGDALVERGVALTELLRFPEAKTALDKARLAAPENAKAAYYLGLVEERAGHEPQADALFAEAAKLDADTYPLAMNVSREAFDQLVKAQVNGLTKEQQQALATTDFSWIDVPALDDLEKGEPVLSPTIVGLFRPGEEGKKDAILIYRKNLLRLCRSEEELAKEVRDTLLHELGHLSGEDDAELRDRGL